MWWPEAAINTVPEAKITIYTHLLKYENKQFKNHMCEIVFYANYLDRHIYSA